MSLGLRTGLGLSPLVGKWGGADGIGFVGVNLTGPEYAWGTTPSNADLDYNASKGTTVVRIPTAWERWQPTLYGALDATYVALIRDLIARAHARGMASILDVHNYGRYDLLYDPPEGSPAGTYDHGAPGTHANSYVLGSEDLPVSAMVDLWEELATEFAGEPGLVGYGLMNEPHDLVSANLISNPNAFTGANWYTVNGAVVTLNAATDPLGGNTAATLTSGTGFGAIARASNVFEADDYMIGIYGRVSSGTATLNFLQNWVGLGTATVTTTWQLLGKVVASAAGTYDVIYQVDHPAGTTIEIWEAQIQRGTVLEDIGGQTTWKFAAQSCIDAIRAIDTDTHILVCGDNFGAARYWGGDNNDLLLTDSANKLIYEAHHYLDDSGLYTQTYEELGLTAESGVTQASSFLNWLSANNVRGLIGEFGVPNTPEFIAAASNMIDAYHAAGVPMAWWEYARQQPTDPAWWPSNEVIRIASDDVDQTRANLLRDKAKAGPFAWPT